jgi:hypothetical protein
MRAGPGTAHVYSSVHGCSCWTGAARDQHQLSQFPGDGGVRDDPAFVPGLELLPLPVQPVVALVAADPGRFIGEVPAGAHVTAGIVVGPAAVPGGLDQQAAGMGVAGLGDPALGPGSAGGMLRRTSSRARIRSRAASSARPGTRTRVICPSRARRARCRRPGRRSSPGPRTDAGAWTALRPGTRPLRQPAAGPGRIPWVPPHRPPGQGPATRTPTRQSRHRWRPGSDAGFHRSPVDRAAFHTARVDIQTDVGTLVHGWNLQTFKCGSTSPAPARDRGTEPLDRQPTNLFEPGVPVLRHATTALHIV